MENVQWVLTHPIILLDTSFFGVRQLISHVIVWKWSETYQTLEMDGGGDSWAMQKFAKSTSELLDMWKVTAQPRKHPCVLPRACPVF